MASFFSYFCEVGGERDESNSYKDLFQNYSLEESKKCK